MKLIKKTLTFRRWLNEKLRIPFYTKVNKVNDNLLVTTEKFKNKQIIKVYYNCDSRYLQRI